jgi:rmlC: dTDP-4-dehydrorhamnose 3,5-epimerase
VAVVLSGEINDSFIPKGFAHGFAVLSPQAIFQYKCDNYYAPQYESGIQFDDPALGIDWKIPEAEMILSAKDRMHKRLEEAFVLRGRLGERRMEKLGDF